MTTSVQGLVVGGPLDGKMLQHSSNRHRVLIRGPLTEAPMRFAEREKEGDGFYDTFEYELVEVHGTLIWKPKRASLGWVLDQLAEAYWRLADLND